MSYQWHSNGLKVNSLTVGKNSYSDTLRNVPKGREFLDGSIDNIPETGHWYSYMERSRLGRSLLLLLYIRSYVAARELYEELSFPT